MKPNVRKKYNSNNFTALHKHSIHLYVDGTRTGLGLTTGGQEGEDSQTPLMEISHKITSGAQQKIHTLHHLNLDLPSALRHLSCFKRRKQKQ